MAEQLINTLKSTADFLRSIYADPSVSLRVREASRVKEIALRQAIVDFETATALTVKAPKKLKVTSVDATPMEGAPTVGEFNDKDQE